MREWIGEREPWLLYNSKLPPHDGKRRAAVFVICLPCRRELGGPDEQISIDFENAPDALKPVYIAEQQDGGTWKAIDPEEASPVTV